jgi:hypothetical protein
MWTDQTDEAEWGVHYNLIQEQQQEDSGKFLKIWGREEYAGIGWRGRIVGMGVRSETCVSTEREIKDEEEGINWK